MNDFSNSVPRKESSPFSLSLLLRVLGVLVVIAISDAGISFDTNGNPRSNTGWIRQGKGKPDHFFSIFSSWMETESCTRSETS